MIKWDSCPVCKGPFFQTIASQLLGQFFCLALETWFAKQRACGWIQNDKERSGPSKMPWNLRIPQQCRGRMIKTKLEHCWAGSSKLLARWKGRFSIYVAPGWSTLLVGGSDEKWWLNMGMGVENSCKTGRWVGWSVGTRGRCFENQ